MRIHVFNLSCFYPDGTLMITHALLYMFSR